MNSLLCALSPVTYWPIFDARIFPLFYIPHQLYKKMICLPSRADAVWSSKTQFKCDVMLSTVAIAGFRLRQQFIQSFKIKRVGFHTSVKKPLGFLAGASSQKEQATTVVHDGPWTTGENTTAWKRIRTTSSSLIPLTLGAATESQLIKCIHRKNCEFKLDQCLERGRISTANWYIFLNFDHVASFMA